MNIDITKLAQKLIDELQKQKLETDSIVKGVALLHDAVRREIENTAKSSDKSVGETQAEKSATPATKSKSGKKNS